MTTQNVRLGILLIREHLLKLKPKQSQYAEIIEELSGGSTEEINSSTRLSSGICRYFPISVSEHSRISLTKFR